MPKPLSPSAGAPVAGYAAAPTSKASVLSFAAAQVQRVSAILDPLDELLANFAFAEVRFTRADGKSDADLEMEVLTEHAEELPNPEATALVDSIELTGAAEIHARRIIKAFGFDRLPATKAELYGLLAYARRLSYRARQLPSTGSGLTPYARLPDTPYDGPLVAFPTSESFLLAAAALQDGRIDELARIHKEHGPTLELEAARWMALGGGDHEMALDRLMAGRGPVDALRRDRECIHAYLRKAAAEERPPFVPGQHPFMTESVFAPLRAVKFRRTMVWDAATLKSVTLEQCLLGVDDTCRYFGDASAAFDRVGLTVQGRGKFEKADEPEGQDELYMRVNTERLVQLYAQSGISDWLAQMTRFAHRICPGSSPDERGFCRNEPILVFLLPLGDYPESNMHSRRYAAWKAAQDEKAQLEQKAQQ